MATQSQSPPSPPELTVLTRVASIPIINDSLNTIHTTLLNNAYTAAPYSTAQGITKAAYRITEPIQIRLAPLITRADGLANKAVDVVESRYPYPFTTPTDELVGHLKQHSDHAVGVANKTIDEKVKFPAYHLAEGIDRRFSPIVDRFEIAVNKLHGHTGLSSPETSSTDSDSDVSSGSQFQYQRAYRLSLDLKDQIYVYSGDQLKQLQTQNVLVQKATDTAYNINALATSSYGAAQAKVNVLSDTMLQELHKIQSSTAALPAHLQASFKEVSDGIASTITDLSDIIKSDASLQEKATRIGTTVQDHVHPLLQIATQRVQEAISVVLRRSQVAVEKTEKKTNGATNGNGST